MEQGLEDLEKDKKEEENEEKEAKEEHRNDEKTRAVNLELATAVPHSRAKAEGREIKEDNYVFYPLSNI